MYSPSMAATGHPPGRRSAAHVAVLGSHPGPTIIADQAAAHGLTGVPTVSTKEQG
jgi:hypothetical protein